MKSELIIHHNTAKNPLLRARDTLLLCSCWIMWGGIATAIFNGSEWSELGLSIERWLVAQEIFVRSLMASFHIPVMYFLSLAVLTASFLLWSLLNLALAPHRRGQNYAPLTLEDMARHFALDQTLIDTMRKEKQILVFHAISGAVTDLRRVQNLEQPQLVDV